MDPINSAKNKNQKLLESEEVHRITLSSISDAVFLCNDNGDLVFICPNVNVIFGYNDIEVEKFGNIRKLLGWGFFDINEVRRKGEIENIELMVTDKFGNKKDLLCNVKQVDIKNATLLFVCRDITKRKRVEDALKESELRHRQFLESSPTLIIVINTEGRIDFLNKRASQVFGRTIEEIKGRMITDILPGQVKKGLKYFLSVIRDGRNYSFEHQMKTVYGDEIFLHTDLAPIKDSKGHISQVVAVSFDITKRKYYEAELKASHQQLRNLAEHVQSVREDERKAISREIHDELGHALTALKYELTWCEKNNSFGEQTIEKIIEMKSIVDITIKKVREISTELRPAILDLFGVTAAIKWHTEEFEKRTGIVCNLKNKAGEIILDENFSTAIFRIFQEAMTNIARHSKAQNVDILLDANEKYLELNIIDDGEGINEKHLKSHESYGLIGMNERATSFGGELTIKNQNGTHVSLKMPIIINENI